MTWPAENNYDIAAGLFPVDQGIWHKKRRLIGKCFAPICILRKKRWPGSPHSLNDDLETPYTIELDYSVAVCCDDDAMKQQVMEFVNNVSSLRAYDAAPLAAASVVESVTPLLQDIARFGKMRDSGVKFV